MNAILIGVGVYIAVYGLAVCWLRSKQTPFGEALESFRPVHPDCEQMKRGAP